VGIFFCTQNPQDVPAPVLSQLGLKIQHALRAFTAADRKVIKTAAENYPLTDYYQVDELLTQLGIGEAFVTLLNEKGIPSPLVHTLLVPPRSRMDVLTDAEVEQLVQNSKLVRKYAETLDSESAHEMITAKLQEAAERSAAAKQQEAEEKEKQKEEKRPAKKEETFFDNPMVKQVGRTAATVITRSLLGALGLGGRTGRSRKSGWF
jgi:DNA helicase HerA-like ATPase